MITIQNLEISIEVEGDEDEQTFARLFNECIRKWAAQAERKREADATAARSRKLVVDSDGGRQW